MKNKRILSVLLTVVLLLSVCPVGLFGITASAVTTGTTGDCTWKLDGTVLTISGNGKMSNYLYRDSSPWGTSVTKVIINNGVTSIGDSAFCNCTGLTSVTIPNSVTSIGKYAFYNCTGLTSTTIPDGVTSIGNYAFSGCSGLTSIAIPNSVTSIGDSAFYDCYSLTSITIPNSVTSIGGSAFKYCTRLTSITIPDCVTSIGDSAFYYCISLEEVTIKTKTVPVGIFKKSSKIKKVYFSKDLTIIYNNAFASATGITDIYYEGTEEKWQKVVIQHSNGALNTDDVNIYFNCTKIPDGIESVTLKSAPTKTEYIQSLETLDLTGGYLTVKYDDGATQNIALSTLTATGFDNSVLGEQTVTVKWGNYSVSFKVNIVKRKISNVSFAMPSTKEYIKGDTLSTAGGKITVFYADGGNKTVALTADMLSGYDMNKTGVQYVGITYEGYEAYFKITVYLNGDMDGDGVIAATDISFLRKFLLGATEGNGRCDINRDGKTDILDLVRIKKLSA